MVLESKFPDGSSGLRTVIERPVDGANERRFDLEDSERPEYITLSKSGEIKYFGWEGRQFGSAYATTIHEDVLTIGVGVVVRDCAPKTLSDNSKKTIRLYEELQSFRDDPDFALVGFSPNGQYYSWLQEAEILHSESAFEVHQEIGFLAGDIMQLGTEYMLIATKGSKDLQYIHYMEKIVQEGMALATCR